MVNKIEKIYLTAIGEPCTRTVHGEIEIDLKKLIPSLKTAYNCEVEIIPGFLDVEFAYNKKRNQYYAPALLQKLEDLISEKQDTPPPFPPPSRGRIKERVRLVGIIDRDLYDEGLNFIFGEAKGKVTIVSIWRFKPCTQINTEEEEKILLERTAKTVIHELGHTLGLGHCGNRRCVMFFSNWLGDTDYKEKTFCEKCKKKLQ